VGRCPASSTTTGGQEQAIGVYPARRFPPPWSVGELASCFVVTDSAGQKLTCVYFEDEPRRRRLRFLQGGHVEKCKTGTTLECVTLWASLRDCLRCGDMEIKMITAEEYRAWAEESLECARSTANESSREAYVKFAEFWLESALRAERLAALLECPSKEPIPVADYEWVLPPFGEWRRKGTPT
jgi:hypothetical protein